MNEGIKLLLERIKTNPEDFAYSHTKGMTRWSRLVDQALADGVATKEEAEALNQALLESKRERFTQSVMKELLAPQEDDDLGKWFSAQANVTHGAGTTLVTTWLVKPAWFAILVVMQDMMNKPMCLK